MSWIEKIVEYEEILMTSFMAAMLVAYVVLIIVFAVRGDLREVFTDKIIPPWKKAERKAAKKAAREEKKARKAEAKYWAKIEAREQARR